MLKRKDAPTESGRLFSYRPAMGREELLEEEAEAYFYLTGGIGEGRVAVADAAEG